VQHEEAAGWELRNMIREPSTSYKLYVLFLRFVCIGTAVRLLKAWWAAPPFRLSRRANNLTYLKGLEADVCNRQLAEQTVGTATFLVVIEDYSTALSGALFVVLFVFLVRWHLLARIERLRR
jgi:hypothetical protein